MRYIPLLECQPGKDGDAAENAKITAWLTKAENLKKEMEAAPDDDARKKIIDDNSAFWGEMKNWLLKLSHNKCWFSEAKDCISHWEVEHFRPKKSIKDDNGTEPIGYWWLAFDWQNYRICGNVPNRKKGSYFPLKKSCKRAGPGEDYRTEKPLLLDPADPDDPSLISFDLSGNAILSPDITDPWEVDRVNYSIERYNLNSYSLLVDQRKLVWSDCWNLIRQYLSELDCYYRTDSPIAHQMYREKAKQIRGLVKEEKPFSSVARACILSTGDKRVMRLLQSA